MKLFVYQLTPLIFALGLQACGGGGSDDNNSDTGNTDDTSNTSVPDIQTNTRPSPAVLTGVLIDAGLVAGIDYTTPSQSGTTNATGEFSYIANEEVQFFLGEQPLGAPLAAGGAMFTTSLSGATEENPDPLVNLTRLLQTLDLDADPSNGIEIAPDASAAIEDHGLTLIIDQPALDFETDSDVLTLISNGGQNVVPSELVDAEQAVVNTFSNIGSSYIVGAWDVNLTAALDPDAASLHTFLILLSTNTFVFANIDERDFTEDDDQPCGHLGLERGTYNITETELTLTLEIDTNGCKGLFDDSDGDAPGTVFTAPIVSTTDNQFVLTIPDDNDNPVELSLTRADNAATDLVGLWQESDSEALLQFLANGVFYFIEDPNISDNGEPFIEIFRYDYNPETATIDAEVLASSSANSTAGETFSLTDVSATATLLNFREDNNEQADPHYRVTSYGASNVP